MYKRNLRFLFAMFVARVSKLVLKILRKKATQFPGFIATKICPDFLGRIAKPKTIIAVTGTNGKTTVSNMIRDVLVDNGYDILDNKFGGNVNSGIVSTLILGSSFFGKKAKKDLAVFEIDERSARLVYPYIKPTIILCTNLFRDSMSRNAHTEYIFNIINKNIPSSSKLILNADDLISSSLGKDNVKVFFGIDKLETDTKKSDTIIQDIKRCPICDETLKFDFLRYHHIGKAHCPSCDFKSYESDYLATKIDENKKQLTIIHQGKKETYKLISDNIINVYNQLAAIAALKEYGLEYEKIKKSFENFKIVKSRFNEVKVNGVSIITHLAKGMNSVACSRTFDYIRKTPGKKAVILNLSDMRDARSSSENIAWIYDTDYEFLNSEDIEQVIIGGARYQDHYLRTLLAGVDPKKIFTTKNEIYTANFVDLTKVNKIIIGYDVYAHTVNIANAIRDRLIKRIKNEVKK